MCRKKIITKMLSLEPDSTLLKRQKKEFCILTLYESYFSFEHFDVKFMFQ